jgi:hypothetical protein
MRLPVAALRPDPRTVAEAGRDDLAYWTLAFSRNSFW